MKNPLVVLGSIVLSCIAIPIAISIVSYKNIESVDKIQETNTIKKPTKEIVSYETVDKESPVIKIYNSQSKTDMEMDIETYLYGVLSGEMPSDFNIEALKAQAIAARTFTMNKQESGNSTQHSNSAVCTDYRHCQEYKSYEELKKSKGDEWIKSSYPKIKKAVDETKGQIIVYEEKPILPLYFSTSSGKTENSEEVFAEKIAYLQSVDSPYDKHSPKYVSTLKISNKDFVSAIRKSSSGIQIDENKLSSQIKIIENSVGGSVEKIQVGNQEFTGRDIRAIFNLNSSNFEINFEENYLDFVVKGYGHGVGMSQWGADGMANDGYLYYEILTHYYTGTTIKDLY